VDVEFSAIKEAVLYGSIQFVQFVQQVGRAQKLRQLAAQISRQPFQCFLLEKRTVLLLSIQ
jgi:hypothetical protein